jgi:RimJ/RimL family protein N-acetyltransferase
LSGRGERNVIPELIETERTRLRPHRSSDVEDVFACAADPEWSRFTAVPSPYTRADAEMFVASQLVFDPEVHPFWAIELEGHVVGGINMRFTHDRRVGEIGYGIARRLWGRGLVVEIARAVIETCFVSCPELVRIRAKADARNTRSIRVMEKLGMRCEALLRRDRFARGELTDEVIYGLLRSEWPGRL